MPRILELFSGTGSIGRVFERAGWEVISVDILPSCAGHVPTLCMSVLDIELDRWPEKYFDMIWASPPCCEYSIAHTGNARDMEKGDMLAIYCLHLISAYRPRFWMVENPQSGKLKTRQFIQELSCSVSDAAYCMYGFPYRKRTRLWHNIPDLILEDCNGHCPAMVTRASGRRGHRHSAQKGPSKGNDTDICYRSSDLFRIPPAMVEAILQAIEAAM